LAQAGGCFFCASTHSLVIGLVPMAFLSMASKLQEANAASSSGAAAAVQASSAATSVTDALVAGKERAAGLFGTIKSKVAGETGAAQEHSAIPSDGTRCEECGAYFGIMRRRLTCSSCDRFLCGSCLGQNALSAVTGITCFCGALCPRCRNQNEQGAEFEGCRAAMENGVSVTLGLPRKQARGGLFGAGGSSDRPPFPAWLSLDGRSDELRWATLEQRAGQPLEEGRFVFAEMLTVRSTDKSLEIAMLDHTRPMSLDFNTGAECEAWQNYLELAMKVLTPESDRATLDEARRANRQIQVEERRARNEERRAQLSQNLGMRFTAEAMISREANRQQVS